MRLDKLLAHSGFGSRKDVKQLVRKEHVTINGKRIKRANAHVDPTKDIVFVNDEEVMYQKYVYLMLNKPQGYLSATEDVYDQTVIDLVPEEYSHYELFPVGRLDKDTEGLLLLTNDGDVNHHLTSPRRNVEKIYYAKIRGTVTEEDVEKFAAGITLDDGYQTKPAQLTILSSGEESDIELTITEGKFHQVKRMFLAVHKKVTFLKRIKMGELELDETLQLGQMRHLSDEEMLYISKIKD